jgi:hypothetical protein
MGTLKRQTSSDEPFAVFGPPGGGFWPGGGFRTLAINFPCKVCLSGRWL